MNETNKKTDKSAWIIGGATLAGLGVGLIFLQTSALYFVACGLPPIKWTQKMSRWSRLEKSGEVQWNGNIELTPKNSNWKPWSC